MSENINMLSLKEDLFFKEKGFSGLIMTLKYREKAKYFGNRYGQDVEPGGYYCLTKDINNSVDFRLIELKKFFMKNPLIIDIDSNTMIKWKYDLSKKYKAKKRKLTQKLLNEGYDSIITAYSNGQTMEMIILDPEMDLIDLNEVEKVFHYNNYKY